MYYKTTVSYDNSLQIDLQVQSNPYQNTTWHFNRIWLADPKFFTEVQKTYIDKNKRKKTNLEDFKWLTTWSQQSNQDTVVLIQGATLCTVIRTLARTRI